MADIYSTDLPVKATEIRNESDAGENTATRVGDMFLSIIDYISQNEEDWLRDTGGTGQDQLQLPVGLTGLLGSLSTVNDLPSGQNKILVWKNADANPNGWGYLTTPTGGTGTGSGDVTWSALTGLSSGYKIHSSYLTDALSDYITNAKLTNIRDDASKYTWWGKYLTPYTASNGVTNYRVVGPLSGGITYIEFANGVRIEAIAGTETTSPALRVVDANTTAGTADFYAMGGVSALGRSGSSSGGGGDTPVVPTDLGAILNHVKNNTASANPVPNPIPEGATIRWNGDDAWVVDKTTWGDLGAVAPSFTANNINFLLKCSTSNGGYSYSYEWIPISSGNGNVTKLSNVGDVAVYNPSADGILAYVNGAFAQEKWQYKRFLINPLQDVTYDGTPVSLTSIILGDTKYNVPTYSVATQQAAGLLSAADKEKLDNIASGANNYSHPTYTAQSDLVLYRMTVDSLGHVASTAVADKWDIANVLDGHTGVNISITGSAARLTDDNTKSAWGKNYWVQGQPQSVFGDIDGSYLENGNSKYGVVKNFSSIEFNTQAGTNKGGAIYFHYNGNLSAASSLIEENRAGIISLTNYNTVAGLEIGLANNNQTEDYIQIGNVKLVCEKGTHTLRVIGSGNEAANFYATGGVSALGMSPGTGSVDTMTFGSLNVEGNLNIYDDYTSYTIGVDHDDLLINCEDGNDIILGSNVYITGSAHITGNTIYMTNKWRFRIDNGTGGTNNCILEYNRSSSSTPDWIQKDSWTAS